MELLPYIIVATLIGVIVAAILEVDIVLWYTLPLSAPELDELSEMFAELVEEYTEVEHELT